jgi:hypothetical protein
MSSKEEENKTNNDSFDEYYEEYENDLKSNNNITNTNIKQKKFVKSKILNSSNQNNKSNNNNKKPKKSNKLKKSNSKQLQQPHQKYHKSCLCCFLHEKYSEYISNTNTTTTTSATNTTNTNKFSNYQVDPDFINYLKLIDYKNSNINTSTNTTPNNTNEKSSSTFSLSVSNISLNDSINDESKIFAATESSRSLKLINNKKKKLDNKHQADILPILSSLSMSSLSSSLSNISSNIHSTPSLATTTNTTTPTTTINSKDFDQTKQIETIYNNLLDLNSQIINYKEHGDRLIESQTNVFKTIQTCLNTFINLNKYLMFKSNDATNFENLTEIENIFKFKMFDQFLKVSKPLLDWLNRKNFQSLKDVANDSTNNNFSSSACPTTVAAAAADSDSKESDGGFLILEKEESIPQPLQTTPNNNNNNNNINNENKDLLIEEIKQLKNKLNLVSSKEYKIMRRSEYEALKYQLKAFRQDFQLEHDEKMYLRSNFEEKLKNFNSRSFNFKTNESNNNNNNFNIIDF